jgi:LPPG:FO 2-phospho-L-lactate transferase
VEEYYMKIVALAGGVGGAKLVDGLAQLLSPEDLTVIVNTGDDFDHWGMRICPDLDTVCYTVAGLANPETGWGRRDETWNVLSEISLLKGEDWFKVGDHDLATHIERTERLANGQTLSQIVSDFCSGWRIKVAILPMTDDPVSTIVNTKEQGELAFQEYFVHQHCEPQVKSFRFTGVEYARPAPGVLEAIQEANAIVFCPSNPWVSLDPILAVPGILPSIKNKKPVVAVSPIIGGNTLKGPAAKMFLELGKDPSAFAVAEHFHGTITQFVLDIVDKKNEIEIKKLGLETLVTNTIMESTEDRQRLASDVLDFIKRSE